MHAQISLTRGHRQYMQAVQGFVFAETCSLERRPQTKAPSASCALSDSSGLRSSRRWSASSGCASCVCTAFGRRPLNFGCGEDPACVCLVKNGNKHCTHSCVILRCVTCHVMRMLMLRQRDAPQCCGTGSDGSSAAQAEGLGRVCVRRCAACNHSHAIKTHGSQRTCSRCAPSCHQKGMAVSQSSKWAVRISDAGDEQWRQQTEGWPASEAALLDVLQHEGPFDGVLGFSQGAAVAAALCAQQQQPAAVSMQARRRWHRPRPSLRFAILCSGYPSAAPEHRAMHAEVGPLQLPTLHVFGSHAAQTRRPQVTMIPAAIRLQHSAPTCDQQVSTAASRQLLDLCEQRLCHVVEHSNGHIIPVDKRCIQRFRTFLLHVAATGSPCV